MNRISGKFSDIVATVFALRGYSLQFAQRVETFELQAAVVAQKLMQTGHLKYERGVIVPALNA
jgi:hypothetical protein